MKTYFSRLSGQFSKLYQRPINDKEVILIIGCLGDLQAKTVNNQELCYITHFCGCDKFKLINVEILNNYDGPSKFPNNNYNSFIKISYEPIPFNIPEYKYSRIRMHNETFKWNKIPKDIEIERE